jgi:hemerythrin
MATKFEWNNSLSTGFDDVDLQHKKLILIIEDVHTALELDSKGYALHISKVVKQLVDYTQYHFSEEETLMRKHAYPAYEAHKREHEAVVAQESAQIPKLAKPSPEDGMKFYQFLGTWLMAHIARADQGWAVYIKGISKNRSF